jgi:hypothetical protein
MFDGGGLTARHRELFEYEEKGEVYRFRSGVTVKEVKGRGDEELQRVWELAQRYEGKGVRRAGENVEKVLGRKFVGRKVGEMSGLLEIDRMLLGEELRVAVERGKDVGDKVKVMQRKGSLGMNAVLAMSLALGRMKAAGEGKELYELIREQMMEGMARVVGEARGISWEEAKEVWTYDELVEEYRAAAGELIQKGEKLHKVIRRHLPVYDVAASSSPVDPRGRRFSFSPAGFHAVVRGAGQEITGEEWIVLVIPAMPFWWRLYLFFLRLWYQWRSALWSLAGYWLGPVAASVGPSSLGGVVAPGDNLTEPAARESAGREAIMSQAVNGAVFFGSSSPLSLRALEDPVWQEYLKAKARSAEDNSQVSELRS